MNLSFFVVNVLLTVLLLLLLLLSSYNVSLTSPLDWKRWMMTKEQQTGTGGVVKITYNITIKNNLYIVLLNSIMFLKFFRFSFCNFCFFFRRRKSILTDKTKTSTVTLYISQNIPYFRNTQLTFNPLAATMTTFWKFDIFMLLNP